MKFDASGKPVGEAEVGHLPGTAKPIVAGSGYPRPVAVDPTSGAVYLGSEGAVTKFDASGVFQLQITETPHGPVGPEAVAVDGSGDLYVADAGDRKVDKFTASGAYIESLPIPASTSLAVGPEGDLYVGLSGEVRRFSSTGAPVDCPGAGNVLSHEGGSLVAVDPSDGHLFTDESSVTEGRVIAEYSSFCAATWNARFGMGKLYSPEGIGVRESTHEVYVGDWSGNPSGPNSFVEVYALITLPSVTTGAATDETRTSAGVSGTVSPEGAEVTSCEFEYGPTVFYGQFASCSPEPPFSGGQVAVGAQLSFVLPPGEAIHYRLKVDSSGGVEYGPDRSFVREAPPTIVSTLPASGVAQFAATLHGMIETGEEEANYHFEYGTTTAYGQIAPIPDSVTPITSEPVPISQPIFGLQAGTTYHYRLVASSPGGTNIAGHDMTFTTLPIPAPTVTTGGPEGVGFGSATLTGTIDPRGWETTYVFQYGTGAAYGQSWPTIESSLGAFTGAQPVVVNLLNLQPGTTYHYRLLATNGGGTEYGPDMTFTTTQYPASIIQETPLIGLPKTSTTKKTTKKLETKAKKLAKALKACQKQDKKNKGKRQTCEKAAHRQFRVRH